jgi:hypothetical protein
MRRPLSVVLLVGGVTGVGLVVVVVVEHDPGVDYMI